MKTVRRAGLLALCALLLTFAATACQPNAGPPTVVILSITEQRVRVYHHDILLVDFPVSSGRNNSTPTGSFHVISKSAYTTSLTDPRVSMRFMTRFLPKIGFHGIPRKNGVPLSTPLGERAVSAGCVRMDDGAAQWIYENVPIGTPVHVVVK